MYNRLKCSALGVVKKIVCNFFSLELCYIQKKMYFCTHIH